MAMDMTALDATPDPSLPDISGMGDVGDMSGDKWYAKRIAGFPVWQWALIVGGGALLGFVVIPRFFNRGTSASPGGSADTTTGTLTTDTGATIPSTGDATSLLTPPPTAGNVVSSGSTTTGSTHSIVEVSHRAPFNPKGPIYPHNHSSLTRAPYPPSVVPTVPHVVVEPGDDTNYRPFHGVY